MVLIDQEFVLRDAHDGDYAFAERLYLETMQPLLARLGSEEDLASNLASWYLQSETRIIKLRDTDIGWLQVHETDEEMYLYQIHLEAEFRSRGIGTRLILDLMAAARADGKPILLNVVRNNDRAIALYRRLGFEIVKENGTKLHMRWEG